MKTTVLTCLCTCVASAALSQGTLRFANDTSSLIYSSFSTPINPVVVPAFGGSVQLVWAPEGTPFHPYAGGGLPWWISVNPGWQSLPESKTTIGPTAGMFDAGVLTLPTTQAGATVQVAVLAWLGNAASFDEAVFTGMSDPFTLDTGNPTMGELPVSIVGANKFQGYTMAFIPEPSVLSLLGMGAGLFLLRRKRR